MTPAGVTDRTFEALRQFYDDQAIVELTVTAAFYAMSVLVTHTLNVQVDGIKLETYGLE
jgi:alkylhydroperoxidase family enzyme